MKVHMLSQQVMVGVMAMVVVGSYADASGKWDRTFGSGDDAFEMTFQDMSGDSNPSSGDGQVNYDYGIGTYEVSTAMYLEFVSVSGYEPDSLPDKVPGAGDYGSYAVDNVSWNDSAHFVNWLNTESGNAPAYNFGDDGVAIQWGAGEQSGTSAYRNKDAVYVLPSDDEWTKAAYWNGTEMQKYSFGDTISDGGGNVNYGLTQNTQTWAGQWSATKGPDEVNGTKNMMGNLWEWSEGGIGGEDVEDYEKRGGSWWHTGSCMVFGDDDNYGEYSSDLNGTIGFRVAAVPEPVSIALIGLFGGGLLFVRRIFMI